MFVKKKKIKKGRDEGRQRGSQAGRKKKGKEKISKDGILKIIGDVFLGLYGS